ncbi:MAG: aldehyde dehydrogenase family protein [Actinomycetia bacterium]|nr:aldehyde dehydrogenase family protein [Actinomycetes bacterium]
MSQQAAPVDGQPFDVANPATSESAAIISLGGSADVDRAATAAQAAFATWSRSTVDERSDVLERAIGIYQRRADESAWAMTTEMGVPITFSRDTAPPHFSGSLTTEFVGQPAPERACVQMGPVRGGPRSTGSRRRRGRGWRTR